MVRDIHICTKDSRHYAYRETDPGWAEYLLHDGTWYEPVFPGDDTDITFDSQVEILRVLNG